MTYISLELVKTEILNGNRRLTLAVQTNSSKPLIDFTIEVKGQLLPLKFIFTNRKKIDQVEIIVDHFYKLSNAIYIINMFSNNIKSNTIIS